MSIVSIILLACVIYAITIVVSFFVAALIKGSYLGIQMLQAHAEARQQRSALGQVPAVSYTLEQPAHN